MLLPKIISGMQFWKANDFLDPNWWVAVCCSHFSASCVAAEPPAAPPARWYNDFGVPMALQGMLVILANTSSANGGAALPKDLAEYGLSLLARGSDPMWLPDGRRGGGYTGENLVWSLQVRQKAPPFSAVLPLLFCLKTVPFRAVRQLDIQRGALAGNASLVAAAFSRMWGSIVIAPQSGDGLMADGSFHQHGALLQSGSYGSGLMTDVLNFVQLSAGTDFAMPAAPMEVIVHYLTAGQQYMIRAGSSVPTATWLVPPRGREISRPGGPPRLNIPAGANGLGALMSSSSMCADFEFRGTTQARGASRLPM